jgi:NADPH-dependent ferric siderophore reductase
MSTSTVTRPATRSAAGRSAAARSDAARSDAAAAAVPFEFFDVQVLRCVPVGRSMRRITFGGAGLGGLVAGGRDQRIKLFLPHPHQGAAVVPRGADWWPQWRSMDPSVRAVMRSYTVSGQRRDPDELDIDFALHGAGGAASSWAAGARPGAQAVVLGPTGADNAGVDFRPPPETGWVLLAADTTALPAVAGILSWLPAGVRVHAFLDVARPEDVRALPTAADATVTWLPADAGGLAAGVAAARLPDGIPYAWIAGESAAVRAVRRHLVADRGVDRSRITFTGYWRRGACEEDLLREAVTKGA